MNILGQKLYSSSVVGMKQPDRLMDTSNKLVFIYPVLIANKIKVSTSTPLEIIIRDFISITFLKELFVQNTISIINMASEIQPLSNDNDDNIFNADATHAKVANSMNTASGQLQFNQNGVTFSSGGDSRNPAYKINPYHSGNIQQKIREKTAIITKHIKTDPKLAPLRPYVEIITLGNLIDVPVIVGTKCNQLDTLTLFHILLSAIGSKTPLYDKSTKSDNLDIICSKIENLKPDSYWTLLNSVTPEEESQNRLMKYLKGTYVGKKIAIVNKKMHDFTDTTPPDEQIFDILNTIKSNLNQTKLFLRFAIDQRLSKSQMATDTGVEEGKRSKIFDSQVAPDLRRLLQLSISNFSRAIETYTIIPLHSLFSILYPVRGSEFGLAPREVTFSSLKSEFIDNSLLSEIDKKLDGPMSNVILSAFSTKNTKDTTDKLKTLKSLLGIDLNDTLNDINTLFQRNDLSSTEWGWDEFEQFIAVLDRVSSTCSGHNSKFETTFKTISSDAGNILISIKADIFDAIRSMFTKLGSDYDQDVIPRIIAIGRNNIENPQNFNLTVDGVINKTIPKFVGHMTNIFYFLFLYQFQHALFNIISSTEFELETTSNDVTTWPNFTLVLPVEIITALHSAIVSKDWATLLRKNGVALTQQEIGKNTIIAPSDDYVKGVVKYVSRLLEVPNLIVIDGKKGDIYYKLMNNSSINKTKLSTLETFVKTNLEIQF